MTNLVSRTESFPSLNFDGVPAKRAQQFLGAVQELHTITDKIGEIQKKQPIFISGLLDDSQIPEEIGDKLVRKYLVLTYNKLKQEAALDILGLPESELYSYKGDDNCTAHEKIRDLAKEYMSKVPHHWGALHYGAVLEHAKALKDGKLSDLSLACLETRKKELEVCLEYQSPLIQMLHDRFVAACATAKLSAQDFRPGNFDFLPDGLTRQNLSHAYQAIEEAKLWHLFGLEREVRGEVDTYFDDNQEIRTKVMAVINKQDAHSATTLDFTMHCMDNMKKIGWTKFVEVMLKNVTAIANQ